MLTVFFLIELLLQVGGTHQQLVVDAVYRDMTVVVSGCQHVINIVDILEEPEVALLPDDIVVIEQFGSTIASAVHNDVLLEC